MVFTLNFTEKGTPTNCLLSGRSPVQLRSGTLAPNHCQSMVWCCFPRFSKPTDFSSCHSFFHSFFNLRTERNLSKREVSGLYVFSLLHRTLFRVNPNENPFIDFRRLREELEDAHRWELSEFILCDMCDRLFDIHSIEACTRCSHCELCCAHTPDIWGWK